MDNKVKLELKTPENTTIEYNGVTIEINPYIDFAEEVLLINEYVKDFFGDLNEIVIPKTKYHIYEAECRLIYYIIQLNTNISMENIDNNIYVENILWYRIIEKIINYHEFRKRLDMVVHEIKEQVKLDNSLGKVLNDLKEKAEIFLDQMNKISPDDLKDIQDKGFELIDELEKSNIMRNPADLSAIETPLIEELKKE